MRVSKISRALPFAQRILIGSLVLAFLYSPAPGQAVEEPASTFSALDAQFAPQVKVPLRISLREKVSVGNARILFDHIASCEGSQTVCEEISAVDFGEAPKPGSQRILNEEFIGKVIREEFAEVEFAIEGAKRVTIQGDFQELTQEMIRTYFVDALTKSLEEQKNLRIDLVQIRLSRPVKVLPGDFRLAFPLIESGHGDRLEWISSHYLGNHSVQVTYIPVASAGEEAGKPFDFHVSVQVNLSMQVPVTKFEIPRGAIVDHANLEYQWIALKQRNNEVVTEIADAVNLRANQPIRAGQAILKRQLAAPILVRRGDVVSILMKKGDMQVRGQARALASGAKGQNIPIVYPSTKKQIQGRVVNQGEVEVLF